MQFVKHYKAHQNAVMLKTCVKLKQVAADQGLGWSSSLTGLS